MVGIIAKEMKRGESMRTHFYALLPTFCTGMGCNDAVAAPAPGLCSTRRCVRRGVVETGIGFGHQVAAGWFVAVHSQKKKTRNEGPDQKWILSLDQSHLSERKGKKHSKSPRRDGTWKRIHRDTNRPNIVCTWPFESVSCDAW